MPEASVQWPQGGKFQEYSNIIVDQHNLPVGAFGSMDGLKLSVQVSEGSGIENATYNGWVHRHYKSSVLVFSPHSLYLPL